MPLPFLFVESQPDSFPFRAGVFCFLIFAGMGYPDLFPFRFLPPKISVFLLLVHPFHLSLVVSFGSGRWWRVVLLFWVPFVQKRSLVLRSSLPPRFYLHGAGFRHYS